MIFVAGCVLQQKIHVASKTVSVRAACACGPRRFARLAGGAQPADAPHPDERDWAQEAAVLINKHWAMLIPTLGCLAFNVALLMFTLYTIVYSFDVRTSACDTPGSWIWLLRLCVRLPRAYAVTGSPGAAF